jgi:hypothetical protein
MIKKAAIYDPYLDTLGGGERYCLTVAEVLLKNNYDVDIFWSGDPDLVTKATRRFDLDLNGLKLVKDIFKDIPQKVDFLEDRESLARITSHPHLSSNIFQKLSSIYLKYKITRRYDLFFYISDWKIGRASCRERVSERV